MAPKKPPSDGTITINDLCTKTRIRVLNALIDNDVLSMSGITFAAGIRHRDSIHHIAYLKEAKLVTEEEIRGLPYYRLDKKQPVIQSLMRIKQALEKD